VFDQTFCCAAIFVGLRDGAIYGGPTLARCVDSLSSQVESIHHLPTLARSRISHPTVSAKAYWSTCPGLTPCLGLNSIRRTLRFLEVVSVPRNLRCVPLAFLHARNLSLVISAAIVSLLSRKSVKCQHPCQWQKTTSSCLLSSAVSCGARTGLAHIAPIHHH